MAQLSLHNLMQEMAQKPSSYNGAAAVSVPPYDDNAAGAPGMAVVPVYAGFDPLLADLYRQYLEAHRQFKSLSALRGKDDPMAEAARDWMDSAESAVQTRMIEVRQDRNIHSRARRVLKEQARQEKYQSLMAALQSDKKEQAALLYRQRLMMGEALRKDSEDGFFMMVCLLWMLRAVSDRVTRTLSLASSFMAVAVIDNDTVLYAKA